MLTVYDLIDALEEWRRGALPAGALAWWAYRQLLLAEAGDYVVDDHAALVRHALRLLVTPLLGGGPAVSPAEVAARLRQAALAGRW